MNSMTKVLLVVFISFLSSPSWSETIEDLVERNGLYYKKFTDVLFTGKISGIYKGKMKNGQLVGLWELYYENGQLRGKGTFKDGKLDGLWVDYWSNGNVMGKTIFTDGVEQGLDENLIIKMVR